MSDRLIPSAQLYVKLLHVRIVARVMLVARRRLGHLPMRARRL